MQIILYCFLEAKGISRMDNANRQGLRSLFEDLKKLGKAHNQTHFASLIGEQSRGNLSNYLNGVKPLGDALAKQYALHIHAKLPEVSHPWVDQLLLSGQPTPASVEDNPGASLPDIGRRTDVWVGKDDKVYWTEALQIGDEEEYQRAKEEGVRLIPQYVESVQGGNDGATDTLQTIDTYWAIPGIDGTAVIPVSGNSMAPNFPSGCHVITRPYPFNPSRPLSLPFGEVYAFALRQEDGFPPTHHIKRLIRHPEKAHERTHYIARSFNPDFADFEVSIDDICMLAAVVARIEVTRTFDF